jgi:hypothetical protein
MPSTRTPDDARHRPTTDALAVWWNANRLTYQ